jgi:hypothetical protein
MKKFLLENWFKMITGIALLLFSAGFFISAVSPAYSSNNPNEINRQITTSKSGGYLDDGMVYFVDKGSVYYCQEGWLDVKSSWKKLCTLPD